MPYGEGYGSRFNSRQQPRAPTNSLLDRDRNIGQNSIGAIAAALAPSSASASTSVSGGGGTRGSTGGGGSVAAPAPSVSPPLPVFSPDASLGDAEDLRQKQLAAAIASIEATFGGNIAQQQALLAELDPRFDRLQQENLRASGIAQEAALEAMAERGIFRSSFTATNAQLATVPYTEAIADAAAIRGQQEQQFKSAIEQFQAQEEAKIVEAQLASEKDAFDFDLYLASLGL